jgi:hypothetical protein
MIRTVSGKICNTLKRLIKVTEQATISQTVVTIFSFIFLRIFLESILEGSHRIGFSSFSYRTIIMYVVHFPMFYLSLFLLLIILMSGITGVDIRKITKTASVGLFAILLVPFIDWVINQGFLITYPLRWQAYVTNFLNPMVSLSDTGISPGQRIVVFSIALLTGVYGRIKTGNMLKGFVLFLASLLTIIFFGCLTTILAGNRPEHVFVAGSILYTDTQKFAAIYAFLFAALSFLFLYVVKRSSGPCVLSVLFSMVPWPFLALSSPCINWG